LLDSLPLYKGSLACLSILLSAKSLLLQEKARERAEEQSKAQEAAAQWRRAASGGYGGGSGPLRGADGRPITDLNKASPCLFHSLREHQTIDTTHTLMHA
jgi:hypothetical protein